MAYYRLYMMDGLTGHVTSFIEIEAGTDAEAVGRAEAQRANVAMELWCGRKKVKRGPATLSRRRTTNPPTCPADRDRGLLVKSSHAS